MNKGHNDQESVKDLFSIEAYTQGLAKFIQECQTPMTIAIQGNWGSGKTSMMKRLMETMDSSALCFQINTWQYSQFELGNQLPIVFFSCILKEVLGYDESKRGKTAEALEKSLFVLAKYGASCIPVVGKVTEKIIDNFESVCDDSQSPIDAINVIKSKFKDAVKECLKKDKKCNRVVFFIDDLDRLEPKKAVELMEIMKILLECEDCVFVLAIDYDVVVRGVKAKYGADIDDIKARNFFDKIIQVPFSLPIGKYNIEKYIKELLLGEDGKFVYGLQGDSNIKKITNLIRFSVGCNPRAIKRVINSYILLREISSIEHGEKGIEKLELILFASLCLQLSYERIYEVLLSVCDDPAEVNGLLASISDGEVNEYLSGIQREIYSDAEKNSLERFIEQYVDCINGDEEPNENIISNTGAELLREAIKSSSSTSVTTTANSASAEDGPMLAKYAQIYEVLEILKKKGLQDDISREAISDAKNEVAKNRGVSQSAITDKTTRQLGIDAERFWMLVNDYFKGGSKLINIIREKNKDKRKEEQIIAKFMELQKTKAN